MREAFELGTDEGERKKEKEQRKEIIGRHDPVENPQTRLPSDKV